MQIGFADYIRFISSDLESKPNLLLCSPNVLGPK